MPVIETGVGNCHVYVDAAADLDMALDDPAQRQDPAAVGVQRGRDAAGARRRRRRVPAAWRWPRCATAGVTVHGDAAGRRVRRRRGAGRPRRTSAREYLSLDIAAAVVDSLDDAVDAHPPVRHRAHRGDRHRARSQAAPRFVAAGRRRGGDGQRLHPVHRRRRVRLRRRDRHLDPEAARPRPDGPAGADLHQVGRHRRRPPAHRARARSSPGTQKFPSKSQAGDDTPDVMAEQYVDIICESPSAPEHVWALLADVSTWTRWSPFDAAGLSCRASPSPTASGPSAS